MKENALVLIVILIASILFFAGCTDSKPKNKAPDFETSVENASVMVLAENDSIKIVLVTGGDDIPSFGYSIKDSVIIKLNGTELSDDNLTGNIGWEVGESLYIGGSTPTLYDGELEVGALYPGDYIVTVTIIDTVVYDDLIVIV